MSAISDHLRQVSLQLAELAELMERQAAELEHERYKCRRLSEMVDRSGVSFAERVILDSTLEEIRADDGAAGVAVAPDMAERRASLARSGD